MGRNRHKIIHHKLLHPSPGLFLELRLVLHSLEQSTTICISERFCYHLYQWKILPLFVSGKDSATICMSGIYLKLKFEPVEYIWNCQPTRCSKSWRVSQTNFFTRKIRELVINDLTKKVKGTKLKFFRRGIQKSCDWSEKVMCWESECEVHTRRKKRIKIGDEC